MRRAWMSNTLVTFLYLSFSVPHLFSHIFMFLLFLRFCSFLKLFKYFCWIWNIAQRSFFCHPSPKNSLKITIIFLNFLTGYTKQLSVPVLTIGHCQVTHLKCCRTQCRRPIRHQNIFFLNVVSYGGLFFYNPLWWNMLSLEGPNIKKMKGFNYWILLVFSKLCLYIPELKG